MAQGKALGLHAGEVGILDAGLGFGPTEGVDQLAVERRINAGDGRQLLNGALGFVDGIADADRAPFVPPEQASAAKEEHDANDDARERIFQAGAPALGCDFSKRVKISHVVSLQS